MKTTICYVINLLFLGLQTKVGWNLIAAIFELEKITMTETVIVHAIVKLVFDDQNMKQIRHEIWVAMDKVMRIAGEDTDRALGYLLPL